MDKDTLLQQITTSTGSMERVNENFDAVSPAALFGRDPNTTSGLSWGFIGGRWGDFEIPSAILALTASDDNYVVLAKATGVVTVDVDDTDWNNDTDFCRIYRVIAGVSTVTDWKDHRAGPGGTMSGAGGVGGGGVWGAITGTLSAQTDLVTAISAAQSAAQLIAQNSKSAAYTLVLSDAGKHILHPSADTTARTFTIPANSSVAFPIGTAVTFVNQDSAGIITLAITTDTMRLAGAGTAGTRTLAANGTATALKITSTEWIVSGVGLT